MNTVRFALCARTAWHLASWEGPGPGPDAGDETTWGEHVTDEEYGAAR